MTQKVPTPTSSTHLHSPHNSDQNLSLALHSAIQPEPLLVLPASPDVSLTDRQKMPKKDKIKSEVVSRKSKRIRSNEEQTDADVTGNNKV